MIEAPTDSRQIVSAAARIDPEFGQVAKEYFQSQLSSPETEPPDPWQPFTLVDAYQDRPPIEYIAGKLFELPSLNIVYGAPGTLKSFLIADLLICAAVGEEWLPPAPWQPGAKGFVTKASPVMWLDFDNGRRRTHDRFAALGKARNLPADIPLYYYSMPDPWLQSTDKASIGYLAQRAISRDVKLICIDNLGCVTGDAEENSGDMVQVMSHFRQLAEDTGAAVCLIHHQRKSNGGNSRAGDSLRGHSSIEASLDLALRIEREPSSPIINMRATKVRGEDLPPLRAIFTYDNDQGGILNTARFYGLGEEDASGIKAIENAIYEILESDSMNKTQLAKEVSKEVGEGINSVRNVIDVLISQSKLSVTDGKRNAKIISIP
jgi:hypothetical protein